MNTLRKTVFMGGLCCLLLSSCQRAGTPEPTSATVDLLGTTMRVSGPYAHDNLTVFLVHSDKQDNRDYLTLDEGLTKGVVKITEQDQASVGALEMDNQSDRPLYLQEGERLSGGKQDRTIIASMVVPAKSGKTTVPTFCIEQTRWVEGKSGKSFGFTSNAALAPKGVRGAGKLEDSQNGVWDCVKVQKVTASSKLQSANTNSSANEMLDSPQVQKVSEEYATALESALRDRSDAIGFAIAVNGQLEEVNVYPNHALLKRLYPRLVRSYAVQAVMLKDQKEAGTSVALADVVRFMQDGNEKSKKEKKIDARNASEIRELPDYRYNCTTREKDQVVHWQMMKKNAAAMANEDIKAKDGARPSGAAAARRGALGGDW
jgi:hypothetical protein